LQDPPKFTLIGIFRLKTNHLEYLICTVIEQPQKFRRVFIMSTKSGDMSHFEF
jgi:hypothetical protein